MPALNYTKFVDKVQSGEKGCTIRAKRKRPIKVGDELYHYTGMRRKGCRLLRTSTCSKVSSIRIVYNRTLRIRVAGRWLRHAEIHELARRDGFSCLQDFVGFFCKVRLAFEGDLIEW
jgi:hypothetical protein